MSRLTMNSSGLAVASSMDTMFWMTTGFHFPSRRVQEEEEEDDDYWDSMGWDDDEDDFLKRGSRLTLTQEQIHMRAAENLGLPSEGEEETWQQRWLRLSGILCILLTIERKRVKVSSMQPYFPLAYTICSSLAFEALVGVMILLNAITIGWDSFFQPGEPRPNLLNMSEHFFTGIFLGELVLRLMAHTWVWIFNLMNAFDVVLIFATGILVMWIAPAFGLFGSDVEWFRKLGCLRILRLARLIRCVRMIPFFRELWILVKGVLDSFSLLVWSWVIIGTVHFMFAVISLELVAKSETFESDETVQHLFGSVPRAMFTLFQVMTFDSWSGFMRPMAKEMPSIMLIFGLFMGIAGIVLFNLMTAVVVKNAFDASQDDTEAQAHLKDLESKNFMMKLTEMFTEMDEDNSGTLTIEEFTDVLDDVNFIRTMKMLDIDLEELPDIFEILDDGDGQITTEEFIKGIMRMQGPAMNKDMLKGTRMMNTSNKDFLDMEEHMREHVEDKLDMIENYLESAHLDMHQTMHMVAELLQKVDEVGVRRVFAVSRDDFPTAPKPELGSILEAQNRLEELQQAARIREVGAPVTRKSIAAAKKKPMRANGKKDAFEELAEMQGLKKRRPLPPAVALHAQKQLRRQHFRDARAAAKASGRQLEFVSQEVLAAANSDDERLVPSGFEDDWDRLGLELSAPETLRMTAKARQTAEKARQSKKGAGPPAPVLASLPLALSGPAPVLSRPHSPEILEVAHPNAVPEEITDAEPAEMLI